MQKLFIHIPKNAGSTIKKHTSLNKKFLYNSAGTVGDKNYHAGFQKKMTEIGKKILPYGHSRWRDLKPEIQTSYQAFAVVRNPWSRVYSRYTFFQSTVENAPTLDEFLDDRFNYVENNDYTWHLAIKGWFPAWNHVCDKTETRNMCDILRHEHLEEDVNEYFRTYGSIKLGQRNKSNFDEPYTEVFNEKQIQIIADWYKKDIDYWGFDFDTSATKNFFTYK